MKRQVGRRQQVLEAIRASKRSWTVSELARVIKVHGNTVRFHLDSLLADGLIEIEQDRGEARSVGRPAVRYRAVARVVPAQMRHTETLVKLFLSDLAEDPKGAERAVEIGRRWGRVQAGETSVTLREAHLHEDVQCLTALLDDMGFESDAPTNTHIMVKSCPFLDDVDPKELKEAVSAGEPALPRVCAVHLGVMEGALEEWDGELGVESLVPFHRVDRCRIGLSRKK